MRTGFGLGRLFGITIRIDGSWLLIAALLTWSLSAGFGVMAPSLSLGLRLVLALVGMLLFFLSVLAHELAHALVARAQGLPVGGITLFLFGGVAQIEAEPPSPRAEFLMTMVGPLASLALGALFLGAAVGATGLTAGVPAAPAAQPSVLGMLLGWLGTANLALGLFNLLPGFPLDGGRLLRAALWATSGDRAQATRRATWAGQALAWLLMGAGIAMVFGLRLPLLGAGLGGLWLALIGWFLNTAAVQSYRHLRIKERLAGVPTERLMHTGTPEVTPETTIADLVERHVQGRDERTFPVTANEQLLGMVSLNAVRKVAPAERHATTVGETMMPRAELATVGAQDSATAALEQLLRRDLEQVAVVERERLVGVVRPQDITRWLQTHPDGSG